jgi:hypothetical protein
MVQLIIGARPEDGSPLSLRICEDCGFQEDGRAFEAISRYVLVYEHSANQGTMQEYLCTKESDRISCTACGGSSYLDSDYAPLIAVQLPVGAGTVESSTQVSCVVKLVNATYRLKSVIYGSMQHYHFTARLVDRSNEVYRYDDMVSGGRLELEGMLTGASSTSWLSNMDGKFAVMAVYVKVA